MNNKDLYLTWDLDGKVEKAPKISLCVGDKVIFNTNESLGIINLTELLRKKTMQRLTERNSNGIVTFKGGKSISNMDYGEVRLCMEKLDDLETKIENNDLVEPVCCADCKKHQFGICQVFNCVCSGSFYCAIGERKEGTKQ